MWQHLYLQRLKRDLDHWIERGWVSPAHAQSILGDISVNAGTRYIPQIFAILGAVLVGFAAMSFVAANWQAIPKILKLTLLFAALWSAWGVAFFAERRGHPLYAEAAVIGGLALFGANIMLIAQIYHVASGTPTWVLLWSLVALAAAWGLSSRAALAISFLLVITWSIWSVQIDESIIHWPFLLPWGFALWLSLHLSWRSGLHLALLTFLIWVPVNADGLMSLIGCGQGDLVALFVLIALVVWVAGLRVSVTSLRFGEILETYGMIVAFGLLWCLQLQVDKSTAGFTWAVLALIGLVVVSALAYGQFTIKQLSMRDHTGFVVAAVGAVAYPLIANHHGLTLLAYAVIFMGLAIWLVAYGTSRNHRFALNAGLVAFTGECLYLYFQTLGTLLNTATFFALGGVILIAGSFILTRIRRRLVASTDAEDATL